MQQNTYTGTNYWSVLVFKRLPYFLQLNIMVVIKDILEFADNKQF